MNLQSWSYLSFNDLKNIYFQKYSLFRMKTIAKKLKSWILARKKERKKWEIFQDILSLFNIFIAFAAQPLLMQHFWRLHLKPWKQILTSVSILEILAVKKVWKYKIDLMAWTLDFLFLKIEKKVLYIWKVAFCMRKLRGIN